MAGEGMRNRENGQAVLLVVTAVALVLAGALGLAIVSAQLFGHLQMAQPASDAAALAGAMSIYAKTNTGGNAFGSATFTCTNGTDGRTPCAYARNNGFGLTGSADAVVVSFPASVAGVTGSPDFSPAFVQVAITRTVPTTFMKFFGAASTNVTAVATAAITQVISPVPIVVLDPTGSPSFSLSGTPNVTICGGPQRSIQVNSRAAGALSVGGSSSVDLSKAGPADTGACTTGTGGDFAVFGSTAATPGWLNPFGATEHYNQKSAPLPDPLSSASVPAKPTSAGTQTSSGFGTNAGQGDCPASAGKGCTILGPGYYASGIQVKNTTAIFQPGIYYLNDGFSNAANGDIVMCSTTCVADTSGCCSNNGVLIYLSASAGALNLTSNSNATLLGSSPSSSYLGILFFVARTAADQSPSLGGGGGISLQGALYMPTQTLSFGGHGGSGTLVRGEIIVNDLSMGGSSSITMELDPGYKLPIDQVALVR